MEDERRALLHKRLSSKVPSTVTVDGRRKMACIAILITQTLERIAFYGISGNLVLFLNLKPLSWEAYNAVNALAVFSGTSYVMALFGGCLGDTFGRYKTICIAFVIYLLGYSMFPLLYPYPNLVNSQHKPPDASKLLFCPVNYSSQPWVPIVNATITMAPSTSPRIQPVPPGDELCSWMVYLAIIVTGIGNGIVKANIAPFGAEQVKQEGPAAMRIFFNWFYWCVNIGAFLALTVVVYIQQVISFFYGYLVPLVCLVLATLIFAIGGCCSHHTPPSGTVLVNIFKVLKEAVQLRYKRSKNRRTLSGVDVADIDKPSTPSCLDLAKVRYGGSFHENTVEDVKALGDILIVFAALVPYWIVYFQMESTFLMQALHMDLSLFSNSTIANCTGNSSYEQIPAASLTLFDVIFLLFLIPLMDRLIYPKLDKSGYNISLPIRICIGMAFAVCAVLAAAVLEHFRLERVWHGHNITNCIGSTSYEAADMSIFLQTPQYALIGISEMFASVAGLEFAYSQAPNSMKGIIFGLFWFSNGVGSFIGTATIYMFNGLWFFSYDNGNISCRNVDCFNGTRKCDCHMDYYYYVLAAFQAVGLLLFLLVIFKGRFKKRKKPDKVPEGSFKDLSYKTNNLQSGSGSATDFE